MATLLTAKARGWGDPGRPGSTSGAKYRAANMVTITVPLIGSPDPSVTITVHRYIAALVYALIHEGSRLHRFNATNDEWGWAHRMVRGSLVTLSNHSWGLAVDLEATTNGMQAVVKGRPLRRTIGDAMVVLGRTLGFRWGGDYSKRADPMHFEYAGTPAQAVLASRQLIAAGRAPAAYAAYLPKAA
jgi:hypothetical protein